jgi:hypothetical protein
MISRLCPAMGAHTTDKEPSDASGAVAITTGICIAACGGDMEFGRTPMTDALASALCWRRNRQRQPNQRCSGAAAAIRLSNYGRRWDSELHRYAY